MGFCFFNNAAVAAKWLRTIYDGEQKGPNGEEIKMQKILILDWDVHHGSFVPFRAISHALTRGDRKRHAEGFLGRRECSLHVSPPSRRLLLPWWNVRWSRHGWRWPGRGIVRSCLVPPWSVPNANSPHSSVNIPFPDSGMTDADYIYAFQQVVMPIAYEFKPDFVIGSSSSRRSACGI